MSNTRNLLINGLIRGVVPFTFLLYSYLFYFNLQYFVFTSTYVDGGRCLHLRTFKIITIIIFFLLKKIITKKKKK